MYKEMHTIENKRLKNGEYLGKCNGLWFSSVKIYFVVEVKIIIWSGGFSMNTVVIYKTITTLSEC